MFVNTIVCSGCVGCDATAQCESERADFWLSRIRLRATERRPAAAERHGSNGKHVLHTSISMREHHPDFDIQHSLLLWQQLKLKYLIFVFSQAAGLRPNVHVFSALIGRAAKRLDYVYLRTILKTMKTMEVWPNELIIQQLEFASRYPLSYNQVSLF